MKPGTIVFTGKTNKRNTIVIRYPDKHDAPEMTRYINTLSKEQTYICFQGEQNTLKDETKFLRSLLVGMKNHRTVGLLVFQNTALIGISQIELKQKAEKHVGLFGISVAQPYRGEGIGKLLMQHILEEGKKHLTDFQICALTVFGTNDLARGMYKKFGFVEFGNLPKGICHKGTYIDHIYMYKDMST